MKQKCVNSIALWFGSGLSPKAPGTMGSLAALPFVIALHYLQLHMWVVPATLLAIFGGVWATKHYLIAQGTDGDPKEVVIDEVAGQWLTFALMPLWYLPALSEMFWPVLFAGFVAFRFFDILKPWPISWIDRRVKGAWGVMLDDLAAAFFAVIVLGVGGHLLMPLIAG